MMDIEYEISTDDLVAFHLHQNEHSLAFRGCRWGFQLVIGLITAAGSVIYFIVGDYLMALLWLVAAVLLVALAPRVLRGSIKRQIVRLYRRGKHRGCVGSHRLSLTPEAMVDATEESESRVLWSSVEKIAATDEHLFIYTSAETAIVVPKRAFSDDVGWAEFSETARQYRNAAIV
ncbi:MAG: YcxB family protein [Chloroflexota bacterium]